MSLEKTHLTGMLNSPDICSAATRKPPMPQNKSMYRIALPFLPFLFGILLYLTMSNTKSSIVFYDAFLLYILLHNIVSYATRAFWENNQKKGTDFIFYLSWFPP